MNRRRVRNERDATKEAPGATLGRLWNGTGNERHVERGVLDARRICVLMQVRWLWQTPNRRSRSVSQSVAVGESLSAVPRDRVGIFLSGVILPIFFFSYSVRCFNLVILKRAPLLLLIDGIIMRNVPRRTRSLRSSLKR